MCRACVTVLAKRVGDVGCWVGHGLGREGRTRGGEGEMHVETDCGR